MKTHKLNKQNGCLEGLRKGRKVQAGDHVLVCPWQAWFIPVVQDNNFKVSFFPLKSILACMTNTVECANTPHIQKSSYKF